jgi:predicted house-cleaning noncanonical NTP pyrophosphatase (MazG superfamily)
MKQYNKLIRDRIVELIEQDGVEYKSRILNDEEYKLELLKKLVEEANEVVAAGNDKTDLQNELADVWEVIEYIVKTFELDHAEIQKFKAERKENRGGFDKKIFLEEMEEK